MKKRIYSEISSNDISDQTLTKLNDDCLKTIFSFLNIKEIISIYNTKNIIYRNVIAEYPFDFYDSSNPENMTIPENMTLKEFRNICGNAIGFSFLNYSNINDKEFIKYILPKTLFNPNNNYQYKRRLKIDITNCCNLTNKSIEKLENYIDTLDMSNCNNITDDAFRFLKGIKKLNISGCFKITDNAFKNLSGIHTLLMDMDEVGDINENITDNAFRYLSGIHTLDMSGDYSNITDKAFINLKGINTLYLLSNESIKDNAFVHLHGISKLYLYNNYQLTPKFISNLIGYEIENINKDNIDYLINKCIIIKPKLISYGELTQETNEALENMEDLLNIEMTLF